MDKLIVNVVIERDGEEIAGAEWAQCLVWPVNFDKIMERLSNSVILQYEELEKVAP